MKKVRFFSSSSTIFVTPASANPILDAETQTFLDRISEAGIAPAHLLSHETAQAHFDDIQRGCEPNVMNVEERSVKFSSDKWVTIKIIRSPDSDSVIPAVIYLHGGGWVMGTCHSHGRFARELASGSGTAVIFVEYTTAEGVQFPVQNEQAYAALCYIVKHAASLGLDGNSIGVAGDGVGGNMAAALTIMCQRRKGPRLKIQLLLYPVLNAPDSTSSYREFAYGPWLTAEAMRYYIHRQFAAASIFDIEALPGNATISDLSGLPPAFILTAQNDVLRDEGESYALKLVQAGVDVTAVRYLGAIHGFLILNSLCDTATSRTAMIQICATLRYYLR